MDKPLLAEAHEVPSDDVACCGLCTPGTRNVLGMAVSFMVLFTAYNTLQNYETSLLPANLGNTSLAILYLSVCVFVFFAPAVVAYLGARLTMVLGGVCYVVYMASLIHVIRWVVLATSVVIGFGAAVLWVAMGSYLALNSTEETRGKNSGMFWSIFQICNLVGNLGAYFVFKDLHSSTWLYIAFTAVGGLGVILLVVLLRPPPSKREMTLEVNKDDMVLHGPSIVQSMAATLSLFMRSPELKLLCPMFFFTGLELAFWTGEFPQLLDKEAIGIVLACAGIGEIVGGMVFGRLCDAIGPSTTVVLGTSVFGASLYLTSILRVYPRHHPEFLDAPALAYGASFGFGAADACFNTQTYAILGDMFRDSTSVGSYTVFQLLQNIGSAVGFYYAVQFPLHGRHGTLTQVWVQVAVLATATAMFCAAPVINRRWRAT